MRIRYFCPSTHHFKAMSWQLFHHLHDLETTGRRRAVVMNRRGSRGEYLELFLDDMHAVMSDALSQVSNEDLSASVGMYLANLDRLILEIKQNRTSKRRLRKRLVSGFLTTHTETFTLLDKGAVKVQPDPDLWEHAVLCAVAIWDNRV